MDCSLPGSSVYETSQARILEWVAITLSRGIFLTHALNPCLLPWQANSLSLEKGFPGGANGKEPACQCRKHKTHGFNPWVGKIPWRRNGNPPGILAWRILWTEEPGGLQSKGSQGSDVAEWLSMSHLGSPRSFSPILIPTNTWNCFWFSNLFKLFSFL